MRHRLSVLFMTACLLAGCSSADPTKDPLVGESGRTNASTLPPDPEQGDPASSTDWEAAASKLSGTAHVVDGFLPTKAQASQPTAGKHRSHAEIDAGGCAGEGWELRGLPETRHTYTFTGKGKEAPPVGIIAGITPHTVCTVLDDIAPVLENHRWVGPADGRRLIATFNADAVESRWIDPGNNPAAAATLAKQAMLFESVELEMDQEGLPTSMTLKVGPLMKDSKVGAFVVVFSRPAMVNRS